MVRQRTKAALLGVGLDKDKHDHIRLTRGPNFHLVGGSEETHQSMQEKCIKLNEKLQARGKELDDLEAHEFAELADQCQMNILPHKSRHG